MVPELPNEVWTLVLGKLEEVLDWGRLQQVSRSFYSILANVAWTKVKGFGAKHSEEQDICVTMETAGKQELLLPVEKALLLVAELANKAVNIINVSFNYSMLQANGSGQYVEFLGRSLDKLTTSADHKMESFQYNGDFVMLSPAFPSLASFFNAKKQTLQHLSIVHNVCFTWCWFNRPQSAQPQSIPELFQALGNCSQLASVELRLFQNPLKDALLESIITGKEKLKNLTVVGWQIPIPVLLNSGIHLVKFHCNSSSLEAYYAAVQGLGTDDHPLFTIKELTLEEGLLPRSLSPLPNLERFNVVQFEVVLWQLVPLLREFLMDHKDHPGDRKELICEFQLVLGAGSGPELADAFEKALSCQTMVQVLEDWRTEVACFRKNAAIICRTVELDEYDVWNE